MKKIIQEVLELTLIGILLATSLAFLVIGCQRHQMVTALSMPSPVKAILLPIKQDTIKAAPERVQQAAPLKEGVLLLTSKNSYTFRGVVSEISVAQAASEIITLSQHMAINDTIYLVLDTPGGDIDAGNKLIDSLKALPQKIKTITIFSASMGFQIAQNLDERLVTPSGTYMSHRAAISGLAGPVPGSALVEINHLLAISKRLDMIASKRMSMDLKAYQELIRDEYWVSGDDAIQDKAADRIVLIRCSADLMGTTDVIMNSLFGSAKITFSKCPAISGPISVDISQMKFGTKENKEKYMKYQNELLYNKPAFVHDYIVGK